MTGDSAGDIMEDESFVIKIKIASELLQIALDEVDLFYMCQ